MCYDASVFDATSPTDLLLLSKDDLHCQLVRLLVSRRADQAFVSAWHSSAGMQKAAADFWARETASHRREGWGVGGGGDGGTKRESELCSG